MVVGVLIWYEEVLINQKDLAVGLIQPTFKQSIGLIFTIVGSMLVWAKIYFVFSTNVKKSP